MRTHLLVLVLLLGLASCETMFRRNVKDPGFDDNHMAKPSAPSGVRQDFQIVTVKNTSAEEIAKVVNDFIALVFYASGHDSSVAAPRGSSEPPIRVVADPRSSSLLVYAPEPFLPQVVDLITRLDHKAP